MTENTPNKVLKSLKASTDLHREIKTESAQTGVKIEHLVERAWKAYKKQDPAAKAQPSAVVPLPGVLDGLNDDQIWTIQNLAEILKTQPQGAIFRSLELTLQLAINEYRKTRSAHEAAQAKTAREGPKSERRPTGTGRNH